MKNNIERKILEKCKICGEPLVPDKWGRLRKTYCSSKCRILAIKQCFETPGEKYQFHIKYCEKYIFQYLDWCKEGNIYKAVWDQKLKAPRIFKDVRLPSLEGYSYWLLKNKRIYLPAYTMKYWSTTKVAFALALNRIMNLQEVLLVNCGLSNFYNTRMTLFLLKVNHGWISPKDDPRYATTSKSKLLLSSQFAFIDKLPPQ